MVRRALADPSLTSALQAADGVDTVAVGKAAAPMHAAFASTGVAIRRSLVVGPADAGHPLPDERSVRAARAALEIAGAAAPGDLLVVLLSGGASALMALPAEGITLAEKQGAVARLLATGADIVETNTVRKHLSGVKGGRLAARCRGAVLTLAMSDVVGDDLSVIGSGPTVADESTWQGARDVILRRGGREAYPASVAALIDRGVRGEIPDTPKRGDPLLQRSTAYAIGGARDAVAGARHAAEALGYEVRALRDPVVGEARSAAAEAFARAMQHARDVQGPLCVLAAGETTVHVRGRGKGGRNQEFALALVELLASTARPAAAASVGTDGVDGPTDAAGAAVDAATLERAMARGLRPDVFLADNNAYAFFAALDDLIRTGPTGTNVGDLQAFLFG